MNPLFSLLEQRYGLHPLSMKSASLGVGGESSMVRCNEGTFVVKFPAATAMDHPQAEPQLCQFLLQRGVPACEFLQNKEGRYLTEDDTGRLFHVKKYAPGHIFAPHTAPEWLMEASGEMLGRIHAALRDYPALPEGIGANFFRFMTPENALQSYRRSLETAREKGDKEAEADLLFRMEIARCLAPYPFDEQRLTLRNTHGDYTIHQLVCGEDSILSVIDWTCACVHPAVWEVIRSFLLAHPGAAEGAVDTDALQRYLAAYCRHAPLTEYDLSQMLTLFFYQLAVCDYWGQYFSSDAPNRHLFRNQAVYFTKVLRHLDKAMHPLT